MRLSFLKKRLARLTAKRDAMDAKCKASTDAAEVRSLTDELVDLNEEITEISDEIAEVEARDKAEQARAQEPAPAGAVLRGADITASFAMQTKPMEVRTTNVLESMEYRSAFRNFVTNGTPIPAELDAQARVVAGNSEQFESRAGDAINTGNTGAVIPVTIVRQIINTFRKKYGNLYSKVRKLNVQGGVEFPVGELDATFHWITEKTVSPEQELGAVGAVSFKYHVAEIRVSQTFLSAVLSIDAFEAEIAKAIALAYMRLMDTAIVKGTGVGQPLGILNDTRVTSDATHTIAMTAADISNWTAWRKKFFAKLPLGYRNGEFIFNNSTVDAYLETMADANNNPIFKQATGLTVDDGDVALPGGRFFGREISLVEPDILTDFDTASSGDVIGIFWQPEEYAINENFGFMMRRYFDEDRNKWVNKALTVVDGKLLNVKGVYLITKA